MLSTNCRKPHGPFRQVNRSDEWTVLILGGGSKAGELLTEGLTVGHRPMVKYTDCKFHSTFADFAVNRTTPPSGWAQHLAEPLRQYLRRERIPAQ